MAKESTHTKSSKQEDERYIYLLSQEKAGLLYDLKRQVKLTPLINGVEVFSYTPDFLYKQKIDGQEILIAEEFKGHEFMRHDFRLRMRICSAYWPQIEFRIIFPRKIGTTYKAGKVLARGSKKKKLPF
jgi:hypothetical protein